jgi:hypothetical protein
MKFKIKYTEVRKGQIYIDAKSVKDAELITYNKFRDRGQTRNLVHSITYISPKQWDKLKKESA